VALEGKTYTAAGDRGTRRRHRRWDHGHASCAASGEELRARHLLAEARGSAQAL